MTNEKRPKPKIKRRPPGLVITPPAPRPVGEDHPARRLFREAIESAKEPAAEVAAAEIVEPSLQLEETASASLLQAQTEPLQLFKELREAAAGEESETVVAEEVTPGPEELTEQAEDGEKTSPRQRHFQSALR